MGTGKILLPTKTLVVLLRVIKVGSKTSGLIWVTAWGLERPSITELPHEELGFYSGVWSLELALWTGRWPWSIT